MKDIEHFTAGRPSHDNGFGFLRLFFASLVILGHTPELRDGNRDHEILTNLFHTISWGDLAVDGFFLISGYLITASYLNKKSLLDYALRRIMRIYPGFLVAYALAVLIAAPLGQVIWITRKTEIASAMLGAFLLRQPDVGAVFAGQPFPVLNGAVWTIIYEFQCYVMIALLGLAGILRRRGLVLMLTAAAIVQTIVSFHPAAPFVPQPYHAVDMLTVAGAKSAVRAAILPSIRMVAVYLIGSCYYLYRDGLRFSPFLGMLAALGLLICMNAPQGANVGFAIFGGYLILYFAFRSAGSFIARINNRNDVSYGLYLYAWPVEKILYWYWPHMPMLLAGMATLALAYGLGWMSWLTVERPAMNALRSWQKHVDSQRVQIATA